MIYIACFMNKKVAFVITSLNQINRNSPYNHINKKTCTFVALIFSNEQTNSKFNKPIYI